MHPFAAKESQSPANGDVLYRSRGISAARGIFRAVLLTIFSLATSHARFDQYRR
jgi:hypothetical protein